MAELTGSLNISIADALSRTADADVAVADALSATANLDVAAAEAASKTASASVAVAQTVQPTASLNTRIVDENTKLIGVEVAVAEGEIREQSLDVHLEDEWGWAKIAAERANTLVYLHREGSQIKCVLIGKPLARCYYIDSNGNLVEDRFARNSITIINAYDQTAERLKILVLDAALTSKVATMHAEKDLSDKTITITHQGEDADKKRKYDIVIRDTEPEPAQEIWTRIRTAEQAPYDLTSFSLAELLLPDL